MSGLKTSLPDGFDYVDLGELLDVIAALMALSPAGTLDQTDEDYELDQRAYAIVTRYRPDNG